MTLSNASLIFGAILSFGVFYLISQLLKNYCSIKILDYSNYPYASFFIYIFVLDFFNYWAHRFMHESKLLWTIHGFHQSATEMTMLTALRDHPLERVILHFFKAIPAAILGMPIEDYFFIAMFLQMIGFIKHSNINSNFGIVGDYLIQSPMAHKIHHSSEPAEYGSNYASIFQFWDVLFGTAKNSNCNLNIEIGLGPNKILHGFVWEIVGVTKDFYKNLLCTINGKS